MTGLYYLDSPTLTESTRQFPNREPLFYTAVIRKRGATGWIFRFTPIDRRGAHETLANLNWGRVAA